MSSILITVCNDIDILDLLHVGQIFGDLGPYLIISFPEIVLFEIFFDKLFVFLCFCPYP